MDAKLPLYRTLCPSDMTVCAHWEAFAFSDKQRILNNIYINIYVFIYLYVKMSLCMYCWCMGLYFFLAICSFNWSETGGYLIKVSVRAGVAGNMIILMTIWYRDEYLNKHKCVFINNANNPQSLYILNTIKLTQMHKTYNHTDIHRDIHYLWRGGERERSEIDR